MHTGFLSLHRYKMYDLCMNYLYLTSPWEAENTFLTSWERWEDVLQAETLTS